jgi:WD40 repeat protein
VCLRDMMICVKVWDSRNLEEPLFLLQGHMDTITSLRVDPVGSYLLSNSMDSTGSFINVTIAMTALPLTFCLCLFQCAFGIFNRSLRPNDASRFSLVRLITPRSISSKRAGPATARMLLLDPPIAWCTFGIQRHE